jgi:hypothetical protein
MSPPQVSEDGAPHPASWPPASCQAAEECVCTLVLGLEPGFGERLVNEHTVVTTIPDCGTPRAGAQRDSLVKRAGKDRMQRQQRLATQSQVVTRTATVARLSFSQRLQLPLFLGFGHRSHVDGGVHVAAWQEAMWAARAAAWLLPRQ